MDWEQILNYGKATQRDLLVSFCADQFEVCKIMTAERAESENFKAAMEKEFLWLEFDANSLPSSLEFGNYKVLSLPEMLLISNEGVPLARRSGSWEVDEMLEWARQPWKPYPVRMQELEGLSWAELAQLALEAEAFGYEVGHLRQKWLGGRPMQLPLSNAEWRLIFDADLALDAPWFQFVLANFDEMEKVWSYEWSDGFVVGAISGKANASLEAKDSLGLEVAFRAIRTYYEEKLAESLVLQFKLRDAELRSNWNAYPQLCRQYFELNDRKISSAEANNLAWNLFQHLPPDADGQLGYAFAKYSVKRDPQYWNLHTLASFELALDMTDSALLHARQAEALCGKDPDCQPEIEDLLARIQKRK